MALEYVIRYAGERINDFADHAILGGSCHVEAGAIGTLTLELPPSHPMARMGAFAKKDPAFEVTLSERYADGTEWEMFRGWVTDTSLDVDLVLTVECEGMLAYLTRTRVRPWSARAVTGLEDGTTIVNGDPFEWLVEQHNLHAGSDMAFEIGFNPHAQVASGSNDYSTTWDELNDKFCTGLDRFLNSRTGPFGQRIIDLLDGGAGEGTQAIVVGENVVEMDLDEGSRDVTTAIIARGQTDDEYQAGAGDRIERRPIGLEGADVGPIVGDCSTVTIEGDRAVNWDMVQAYGYMEEMREYDATTKEDLARAAAAELNPPELEERDVRAFDIQAIDLHALNPDVQPLRLLDWTEVFIRAEGQPGQTSTGRLIFHGWLPCTAIDFDLADPAATRYHFGDLPETLTRKSALRLGMLRRGNGTLVRKAGATEWNNDRSWNRTDEVWEHTDQVADQIHDDIEGATELWNQHLEEQFDTHTQEWYESLDEAQKENAQGREELLKHLDEVEGKWSDDLGRLDGDLGDLSSTVDSNHRTLLDGIRDVAENAQRTFFGTSGESGSARTVPNSALTKPGGETFTLTAGQVVDVKMTYAWDGACTLNIASTGARQVRTNGANLGIWQAGQVVRFLYDGSYWQACSTDIYGSSITVGNPAQANFYTNGNAAQLRIGSNVYWNASMTGQTVGLTSQSHVDIGSTYVDINQKGGGSLHMTTSSTGSAIIHGDSGVMVENKYSAGNVLHGGFTTYNNGASYVDGTTLYFGNDNTLTVWHYGKNFYLNKLAVVMKSIPVTVSNSDFVNISAATLGVSTANGYAWAVTNGDLSAQGVAVIGSGYNPSTRGIRVHFLAPVTGSIRLNVLGIPVGSVSSSDQPMPGPEMFDGPESTTEEGEVADAPQ